jgi:YesN/AraC family two-component response regulator
MARWFCIYLFHFLTTKQKGKTMAEKVWIYSAGYGMLYARGGIPVADLAEDIQNALAYIEENLTGDLEIREIARRAYLSPFYFQRIFGAMCGISVGAYIRNRRMTQAAEKLAALGYTNIVGFGGIIDWPGETVSGE